MVKVFVQKMQIKYVGLFMVFLVLFCGILGRALEDNEVVIKGIISGFHLISSSSKHSDETLVDVLGKNCRQELIHLKHIFKDLGISILEAPRPTSRKSIHDPALSEDNVRKVLSILDPQIKQRLYRCLSGNYAISVNSGANVGSLSRFQNHPGHKLPASSPTADSRRQLAEAPSPKPSGSKRPNPKQKYPPAEDTLVIAIPVPGASPSLDETADTGSDTAVNHESGGHKIIIIVVVVTAVTTLLLVTILFLCCRKAFGGGSDSSSKTWTYDNSSDKEKNGNRLSTSNHADTVEVVSSGGGEASVEPDPMRSSTASLNDGIENESSSALKPPPGRVVAPSPGLPPLKPPPGRTYLVPHEPLPSMPPASGIGGPAPPPPPPPKPPAAPPPPPPKKGGPKPPGPPPPPPGKPGPRAPLPPKGSAPPRPPPSASKPGSSAAEDEANAAKAKLKPFFWDKVMANPDHSMVWDQIKAGSFQFNEEMIESLFGYAAAENKNEKKKDSASRDPVPQFIQLIDPKKAQNLSILLRALNVTTEEVRDAVQEGNELPSELLETLLKMAPTAEEELKLRLFSGEISQLGPAERFLKVMVDIPFAFRRIEALLFMGTLEEESTTVKYNLKTLEAACKELRNSRLFLKLLEAVLKTGNRMNDGTYRGGAQAFKLDTLLKLADVKGTDGKTTLLHFVVQEIIRSEGIRAARGIRQSTSMSSIKSEDLWEDVPDDSEDHYRSLGLEVVSGVGDQVQNVRKAACLDSDSVTGTIAKLGSGLLKAKNFLNKEMDEMNEDNGFHKALRSFVENAEGDVMRLLEEEKRIMSLVKSTADYFHGNSGKEEGLRLFVIVRDFLIMLEKVCREVKARPKWPSRAPKKEPPSRQTSTETPRTPFSPDFRQRLFPAIAGRRMDGCSSDDD